MTRTLPGVIADILSYKGAEVEKKDDSFLEALLPEKLSLALNIPEYARLSFSCERADEGVIDASYDSLFFTLIKGLFSERGFAFSSISPLRVNLEKIVKLVGEKINFKNATFRLEREEFSHCSYLLAFFKYIAISDEKNEGILPFLLNCMNLSTIVFEDDLSEILKSLEREEKEPQISGEHLMKMLKSAHTAATYIIPEKLKDFEKSLERRLNRDIRRVYEYYENLKEETKKAIEKKKGQGEDVEKLQNRLNIIEAEQRLKIQDLNAQYCLSIHIEPLAAINISVSLPIFWINIKRSMYLQIILRYYGTKTGFGQ
ncbi:MAG: hypothetical protein AB1595_00150 [bacterium]